jgi:lipopolysaccharide export system protein LptA
MNIANLIKIVFLYTGLLHLGMATPPLAVSNASLTADSVIYETSDSGVQLTLTGPVEVIYFGDTLNADSAVLSLIEGADSFEDAIKSIQLNGSVRYRSRDGASGSASQATYVASGKLITLTGNVSFRNEEMTATSGRIEYGGSTGEIRGSNGCTFNTHNISVTCDSGIYEFTNNSGTVTGNVEITLERQFNLFDEQISQVKMTAASLYFSTDDGTAHTGVDAGVPAVITAGSNTLTADNISFSFNENKISGITADGNVQVRGPSISLTAESVRLTENPRVLSAEGNVQFDIKSQNGSADSIQVNFDSGWSISLQGAKVSGTITDDLVDEINNSSDTD